MSEPTSTPRKGGDANSETTASGALRIAQDVQIGRMNTNLLGHSWQFPADDIARMLSPKKLRPEHSGQPRGDKPFHHELSHFDTLIDEPVVLVVMNDKFSEAHVPFAPEFKPVERDNYETVAVFLNNCITLCKSAYLQIHLKTKKTTDGCKWKVKRVGWWGDIEFIAYDRDTGDTVKNSPRSLKPDVVGGLNVGSEEGYVFYWSLLIDCDDELARQIEIVCEVKGNWKLLVLQSGTYARAELLAAPLRSFTLAIAVNHKEGSLRVLIFHRGGLSASRELDLSKFNDRRQLLKILLSIMLWQDPADAGLPTFTDGEEWIIPSGDTTVRGTQRAVLHHHCVVRSRDTYVATVEVEGDGKLSHRPRDSKKRSAQQSQSGSESKRRLRNDGTQTPGDDAIPSIYPKKKIYDKQKHEMSFLDDLASRPTRNYQKIERGVVIVGKCSWPQHDRNGVEAKMFEASRGEFGTPLLLSAYEPFTPGGYCVTNVYFLPPCGSKLEDYYWAFSDCEHPSEPDYRNMVVSWFRDEGESLEYCKGAEDLCECLMHAMLGWLSAYKCGYMQRDVSIGNVLKLKEPIELDAAARMRDFDIVKFKSLCDGVLSGVAQNGWTIEASDKFEEFQKVADPPKLAAVIKEISSLSSKVEEMYRCFRSSGICKAIISDGDLACYVANYFSKPHDTGTISGTIEFMSPTMRRATEPPFLNKGHLHTPVDDHYSFFYLTLWGSLRNYYEENKSEEEKIWREEIHDPKRTRDKVTTEIKNQTVGDLKSHSKIFGAMIPLLRDWFEKLAVRDRELRECLEDSSNAVRSNHLLCFEKFAYLCVSDFLTLVRDHKMIPLSS